MVLEKNIRYKFSSLLHDIKDDIFDIKFEMNDDFYKINVQFLIPKILGDQTEFLNGKFCAIFNDLIYVCKFQKGIRIISASCEQMTINYDEVITINIYDNDNCYTAEFIEGFKIFNDIMGTYIDDTLPDSLYKYIDQISAINTGDLFLFIKNEGFIKHE